MTVDALVKVSFPYLSGFATDVSVNDWSFTIATTGDIGDVFDALEDFYNTPGTGAAGSVSRWLSPIVDHATDAAVMKAYNRASALGSPPFAARNFTIDTAVSSSAAPAEAAVVLSFQALITGLDAKGRRKGRIYLGPFNRDAVVIVSGHDQPDPVLIDDVARAAEDLYNAMIVSSTFEWVVWSKMDAIGRAVTQGYVDNAWDVMRSRGTQPTTRNVFP